MVLLQEKQRAGANRVLKHMIENKKAEFDELTAKYDPDNKYLTKYKAELDKLKEQ